MLSDYLIRCGVILQFIPPGANPAISEPLTLNPPAVIRQVGFQEEQQQQVPELDEDTVRQLIELREAVGIQVVPNDAADFEATLREEFGGTQPEASASQTKQSTIDLLRATSERLDEIANQLERRDEFESADDLRSLAQRLRIHSRAARR